MFASKRSFEVGFCTAYFLDASAVRAVSRKERGADVIAPVLHGALISSVNYSAVLKKALEVGSSMELARLFLN